MLGPHGVAQKPMITTFPFATLACAAPVETRRTNHTATTTIEFLFMGRGTNCDAYAERKFPSFRGGAIRRVAARGKTLGLCPVEQAPQQMRLTLATVVLSIGRASLRDCFSGFVASAYPQRRYRMLS